MKYYPLITIGITSYCAEETITRALKSAILQNWPNIEILIVDDCSSDSSVFIIQDLIRAITSAQLIIHEKNLGPAAARNTLLNNANGEYLVFFDDDDESAPDRLNIQFEAIQFFEKKYENPLIACYASGARIYQSGYRIDLPAIGSKYDALSGDIVLDYLLFNSRDSRFFYGAGTPACALMAKVETFKAIGGFDNNLRRVEDVDFAIRLAKAGGYCVGTQAELFCQYATSGSDKSPKINYESELKVILKNEEYLMTKRRFEYAKIWFKLRYYYFSKNRFLLAVTIIIFLAKWPKLGSYHFFKSSKNRIMHELKQTFGSTLYK